MFRKHDQKNINYFKTVWGPILELSSTIVDFQSKNSYSWLLLNMLPKNL